MAFQESYPSREEDRDALFISLLGNEDHDRYLDLVMKGGIGEWAGFRLKNYGEFIAPEQAYIEWGAQGLHRVAWVKHYGGAEKVPEQQAVHHIICECSSKDPENDVFVECTVWENALLERAALVSRNWHIPEMLTAYSALETSDFDKNEELNDLLVGTMESLLINDKKHPEEWVGNLVSGEHDIGLMSHILQQPVETVEMCAAILALQDKVELDGNKIKLAA
jgi:hypothetical protein